MLSFQQHTVLGHFLCYQKHRYLSCKRITQRHGRVRCESLNYHVHVHTCTHTLTQVKHTWKLVNSTNFIETHLNVPKPKLFNCARMIYEQPHNFHPYQTVRKSTRCSPREQNLMVSNWLEPCYKCFLVLFGLELDVSALSSTSRHFSG